jgi:hypothetical protein
MDKILKERLTLIFEWYKGLVSEETGRLVYIYAPAAKTVRRRHPYSRHRLGVGHGEPERLLEPAGTRAC